MPKAISLMKDRQKTSALNSLTFSRRGSVKTLNPSSIKAKTGPGDTWGTPFDLWEEIREKYFTPFPFFDPCPNRVRILPHTFCTPDLSDGLGIEWTGPTFVNPPFSDIFPWASRASDCEHLAVLLVPVRSDQKWFQIYGPRARLVLIGGRVNYVDVARDKTSGASFPSCLLVFNHVLGPGVEYWTPDCHQDRRRK